MLVLSRKDGERIRIGDDVTLTIVSVKGKRVRLGIEAPDHCRIVREEMLWTEESHSKELEPELAAC
ncbi:MAG: carbon storage regulator [Planctomycetaceae bacterium]|nr:carbon storage regulator [Planctomycetaceae bacterium]